MVGSFFYHGSWVLFFFCFGGVVKSRPSKAPECRLKRCRVLGLDILTAGFSVIEDLWALLLNSLEFWLEGYLSLVSGIWKFSVGGTIWCVGLWGFNANTAICGKKGIPFTNRVAKRGEP